MCHLVNAMIDKEVVESPVDKYIAMDLICIVCKSDVYETCSLLEQSAALTESSAMTPKDKKSEDDTTKTNDSKTEWSEEEKRRLLDALKKYLWS